MSDDDKIAEIRTRHEVGPRGHLPVVAYAVANADRGFLLAEVERLRADNERLRADNEQLRADNKRLRGALTDMMSGWRYIRETYGDLAETG